MRWQISLRSLVSATQSNALVYRAIRWENLGPTAHPFLTENSRWLPEAGTEPRDRAGAGGLIPPVRPRAGVAGSKARRRPIAPLWKFLKEYSYHVRWRDACSFVAEIHGALNAKFGPSHPCSHHAAYGDARKIGPFGDVVIAVGTPTGAGDLERLRGDVEQYQRDYGGGVFVLLVTRWFKDPKPLLRAKKNLERMGVRVAIKKIPGGS